MLRPLIALALSAVMLLSAGCVYYYWGKVEAPVDENIASIKERVLAVATTQGEVFDFDDPGGNIRSGFVVGRVDDAFKMINVDEIQRLWLRGKKVDAWKTIGVSAAGTVGVLVILGVVVVVIAIATKNSCPFVYSWDGDKFVFDAEPYGGAISKGLERDDYAELQHLAPCDGVYRLRVTNEVPETQSTNLMQLLVVDHDAADSVAPDASGSFHALGSLQPPRSARNRSGQDLRPWLEATDRRIWEPLPGEPGDEPRQEIIMTFEKPAGATTAKLVANAATGQLGARVIREFLELHGTELESFYEQLDQAPQAKADLFAWLQREGLYRLEVEVEEPSGWQTRGVLEGEGPLLAEHRVIALDVSRVRGDRLRVRIRPAVGFWALNSFAVDYGKHREVAVQVVPASSARDARGGDLLPDLRGADDRYWVMPEIGDWGTVEFPVPVLPPGLRRTVFLHSRGYYKLHMEQTDQRPDRERLRQIMTKSGGAVRFAAACLAKVREAVESR